MDFLLIISEFQHFLLTLGIAILLYWRFRNWRLILICFVFGFFIDVDHWFDYFACFGLDFNLAKFFGLEQVSRCGQIFVLLHGWEFVPVFWLMGRWLGKRKKVEGLEWAIALPYLGHLFIDHFSLWAHPLAYSFIYRLLNNFSLESFDGI